MYVWTLVDHLNVYGPLAQEHFSEAPGGKVGPLRGQPKPGT